MLGGTIAALMALVMLFPAAGSAATKYPSSPNSRNFDSGGTGGWTPQVSFGGVLGGLGICGVGGFLCPTIEHERLASGGNPGGYLNTNGSGTIALLSTAGSTWTSPPFEYQGDGGKQPDLVYFSMDGLADIGGLLAALPGGLNAVLNNVRQSVAIVNNDNPDDVVQILVPEAPLTQILGIDLADLTDIVGGSAEPSWETAAVNLVNTSSLKLGNWYRIRVTTEYAGLAGLGIGAFPAFDVGLDNVELTALTGSQPGGPGGPGQPGGPGAPGQPGGPGGKGADGRDGGAILTTKTLRQTINRQFPRQVRAARNGRWIRIPVRCPKKFNKRCVFRTVAKLNAKSPRITRVKKRAVARGVKKTKALFVKRPFRAKVKRAKRVRVIQVVRVGKVKARVARNVRLVKR